MKRIAFLALFLNIAACGANTSTSGDTNVSHDTDTTGADQSIQVDLPADGKAPAVNVTVRHRLRGGVHRDDRKPDTK